MCGSGIDRSTSYSCVNWRWAWKSPLFSSLKLLWPIKYLPNEVWEKLFCCCLLSLATSSCLGCLELSRHAGSQTN
jgi:hypothetical protein